MLTDMGKLTKSWSRPRHVGGRGLHPSSSKGSLQSGRKRTVLMGPSRKQGGRRLLALAVQVERRSVEWLKRCPMPHPTECEAEIRQVFSPEDFVRLTPELRKPKRTSANGWRAK